MDKEAQKPPCMVLVFGGVFPFSLGTAYGSLYPSTIKGWNGRNSRIAKPIHKTIRAIL